MIQPAKEEEWTGDVAAISANESFWISPEGRLYNVDEWGHWRWAEDHDATNEELYALGWLKKSYACLRSRDDRATQAQLNVLFAMPPASINKDPKDIEVR